MATDRTWQQVGTDNVGAYQPTTAIPEPLSADQKLILDLKAMMQTATKNIGHPKVYEALAEAALLHASKNRGYRSDGRPFANFEDAPPVVKGKLTTLQYAYTLMAKQDDAVVELIFNRIPNLLPGDKGSEYGARGGDAMLRERLLDGIVYRAILLAMLGDGGQGHA